VLAENPGQFPADVGLVAISALTYFGTNDIEAHLRQSTHVTDDVVAMLQVGAACT
jgi:hypothetical protein